MFRRQKLEVFHYICQSYFGFKHGKSHSNATSRTMSKRQKGIPERNDYFTTFFSIQMLHTGAKIHISSKKSHVKSHIIQEIHIFQIALLAKFTFLRSHFKNRIFHKNHISEVHISQKNRILQPIFHKKRIFKISCSA